MAPPPRFWPTNFWSRENWRDAETRDAAMQAAYDALHWNVTHYKAPEPVAPLAIPLQAIPMLDEFEPASLQAMLWQPRRRAPLWQAKLCVKWLSGRGHLGSSFSHWRRCTERVSSSSIDGQHEFEVVD